MSWIETLHGNAIDFADVLTGDPQHYDLDEIAWSLASINRYIGHTPIMITVAEHSVAVSRRVAELAEAKYSIGDSFKPGGDGIYDGDVDRVAAAALMHDAHEAYVGDMSAPLKHLLRERGDTLFDSISEALDVQIYECFGLDLTDDIAKAIKQADREACAWERANIQRSKRKWPGIPKAPDSKALVVRGLPRLEARALFLDECERLGVR